MNPVYRRHLAWCQTRDTHIAGVAGAIDLVERVGILTHFPTSPEFANVYSAHMGDPEAKTDAKWDTPSGRVYTWRWEMGARQTGFYGSAVRKRPTWIRWDLLPAILRLRGERRAPDELFELGQISANAYRIANVLEAAGGTLTTRDLRAEAGFPSGKEHRSAYLKAMEELDTRLMVGKTFSAGEDEMSHQLVFVVHREHLTAADSLTEADAWDAFLLAYLPLAAFISPSVLARHLGVDAQNLATAIERLVHQTAVREERIEGYKGTCYVWTEVTR